MRHKGLLPGEARTPKPSLDEEGAPVVAWVVHVRTLPGKGLDRTYVLLPVRHGARVQQPADDGLRAGGDRRGGMGVCPVVPKETGAFGRGREEGGLGRAGRPPVGVGRAGQEILRRGRPGGWDDSVARRAAGD
jgi:hypothetical protein